MSKPTIAVIIGSTRQARFGDKPARWFMEKVSDHADLAFELVDLRDFNLPIFDEVASNAYAPSASPEAQRWQEVVKGFDGYVFVLPEYNHSLPGALKNALDHDYTGWNRKPMGAVAYGSMGGARSLEHLRGIAVELQMVPLRNAVHIGGGDFFTVWSGGQDKPMSEIEDHLEVSLNAMLDELVWWTKATKAAREA
ncbi:NADPH-dependent FMN reductase [Paracoccus contaminans]|uniref:FMN reductase n=1 Tax=Paracoccus contaminans TaxID=1945662 RepID=A0A1W6CU08_9RHOB|nr:NADPH-dependent FMN reductase [Paracoccus contaminans]ARJ68331.1 FMN reductase [Paracoccus contaminans]